MKISSARRSALRGLGAVALLGGSAAVFADDPIPKPFPMSHFEKLAAHSPFSPPTAVLPTPPPAATPLPTRFSDRYTLALVMQQGEDYVATLVNKETSERTSVHKNGVANQGLNISSVEWANIPAQTKVTLVKDKGSGAQEFGVVEFDPNSSGSATAPGMPVGVPVRPNLRPVPPIPGAIHPPPGVVPNRTFPGAVPNNQPIRRPNIIRAPGAPAAPLPNQPGVNFTNSPRKPPIPGKVAGDDDDDDDE